jgi:uncharacterized membrane protein
MRRIKTESWFLTIGLTFGILWIAVVPPFQSPDEYNHFFRTFHISQGKTLAQKILKQDAGETVSLFPGKETTDVAVGDELPRNLVETALNVSNDLPGKISKKQDINRIVKLMLEKGAAQNSEAVFVEFPNSALYHPISYPHVLGVLLGRIAGFSPLALLYMGRLCGLLAYLAVVWYGIRTAPILKGVFLMLGLMPMSLFLASSIMLTRVVGPLPKSIYFSPQKLSL